MKTLLGIDLGTSSVKVMLLDAITGERAVESEAYDVVIPVSGQAEQSPALWWDRTVRCIKRLKQKHEKAFGSIAGIGLSGQMHGLVALGEDGKPVRPAILWLDQRSGAEVDEMNQHLTAQECGQLLHNRIYPGFAFPSLLWMRKHEPELYEKTDKVIQPKDYIRYRLTGNVGTDHSDASATAAYDVGRRRWALGLIREFSVREELFPQCGESTETAGHVTAECESETGLKEGIPVVYGCGDQMAQSIGNGIVKEGLVTANIGTGGQVSAYAARDIYDHQLRTHTFCHGIADAYTIYGATLSCGLSLKWITGQILDISDFKRAGDLAEEVPAGSGGLIYLPYLAGERTPVMNPHAKGVFYGLKLEHDKRYMIRSVMEGMIFSLKDSLVLLEELGISSSIVIASGGGASGRLLLQMQADIFEKQVMVCDEREQACLGACILAGTGVGVFGSIKEACEQHVHMRAEIYEPDTGNQDIYRKHYELYHQVYRGLKAVF